MSIRGIVCGIETFAIGIQRGTGIATHGMTMCDIVHT